MLKYVFSLWLGSLFGKRVRVDGALLFGACLCRRGFPWSFLLLTSRSFARVRTLKSLTQKSEIRHSKLLQKDGTYQNSAWQKQWHLLLSSFFGFFGPLPMSSHVGGESSRQVSKYKQFQTCVIQATDQEGLLLLGDVIFFSFFQSRVILTEWDNFRKLQPKTGKQASNGGKVKWRIIRGMRTFWGPIFGCQDKKSLWCGQKVKWPISDKEKDSPQTKLENC